MDEKTERMSWLPSGGMAINGGVSNHSFQRDAWRRITFHAGLRFQGSGELFQLVNYARMAYPGSRM